MVTQAHRIVHKGSVSREIAAALVDAAIHCGGEQGLDIAVAVTDESGHLIAFERSDRARVLAIDVAIDKAWTSAASGMPTHLWNDLFAALPAIAPLAGHPRLLGVAGGLPLLGDGQVIGAIGVSGGAHHQDQEVATRALRALGFDVPG